MSGNQQAILVVDDRPANLVALRQTLEETGAEIVEANSGEQALVETLRRGFALAILDVQMPGMDGYELAELLRGNPDTRNLPIVFLTAAFSEKWQIFKGYESGAVDYIIKPYDPPVLLSKVRVFLQLHAQRLELERSREQLTALNRELEAFAYSVSHDLRAPLRAIEGFSQALLEDCLEKLDAQGRDYLQRVSGEARRMSRLIDNLLRLSRVTRAEMKRQKVDLSALAREIAARLAAAEPGRRVQLRIAEDLAVEGDPGLLEQALENLLANAWKFTGRTEAARIEVGREAVDGRSALYVRDNGVGFDIKRADKLFAPFQRMHAAADFPGTGVGLSTVQRVVARHGGRVWCESEPGAGAVFFFTLGSGTGGKR